MLRELHLSGLGVIDDVELELHPGLNVLTGETGAGKTMVTVGLALAIGGRATAALVRTGSPAARGQGRVDAGPGGGGRGGGGGGGPPRTGAGGGRGAGRVGGGGG